MKQLQSKARSMNGVSYSFKWSYRVEGSHVGYDIIDLYELNSAVRSLM